jgi:hypothetical protein
MAYETGSPLPTRFDTAKKNLPADGSLNGHSSSVSV